MLNRYSIGNYYMKDSIIHRLNPICKVISLILCLLSLVFANSIIDFIVIFIFILGIMFFSKIDLKIYFRNIYTLKIFIIILLVFSFIFFGIVNTVYFLFRIVLFILLSAVLTLTTPPTEIMYGIESMLRIFNKVLPINKIALVITLSLRFIPVVTMEKEKIVKASSLRGIDLSLKDKKSILSYLNVLKSTLYLSLRRIFNLKEIMYVRLYNYGISRSNYRMNKWKIIDSILLILNIVVLIIVIWRSVV